VKENREYFGLFKIFSSSIWNLPNSFLKNCKHPSLKFPNTPKLTISEEFQTPTEITIFEDFQAPKAHSLQRIPNTQSSQFLKNSKHPNSQITISEFQIFFATMFLVLSLDHAMIKIMHKVKFKALFSN
jgi:hypothetical protein